MLSFFVRRHKELTISCRPHDTMQFVCVSLWCVCVCARTHNFEQFICNKLSWPELGCSQKRNCDHLAHAHRVNWIKWTELIECNGVFRDGRCSPLHRADSKAIYDFNCPKCPINYIIVLCALFHVGICVLLLCGLVCIQFSCGLCGCPVGSNFLLSPFCFWLAVSLFLMKCHQIACGPLEYVKKLNSSDLAEQCAFDQR